MSNPSFLSFDLAEAQQNTGFRLNTYSFLAEIFLQEPHLNRWPKQYQIINEQLKEMGEIPSFLNHILEGGSTIIEKVRQEFYDCFFVPRSERYVPPFESALRNYKPGVRKPFGALNSPEGNHVAQCYKALNFDSWELNIFAPLREIRLPDHIGFELAFMAMLCGAEYEAWKNDQLEYAQKWREMERRFLVEHLSQWISQFSQALQEIAPGFYADAAKVTEQWVLSDSEDLVQSIMG
ncbi:TorD/DmsD family molecular chaperone [Desulfitobacterium sp. AusDCA]|uniref:TorD/DmsD family molecular chaperone n=1 Tax=Desulfitobacterium sp. AusDCA TaxID=3240383 RepID=UPI003DA70EC4